ncbi:hypothetical protein [Pseudomonas helleri]|uniref:hypothetical protein n=1 Tax=Pseudomonas helleri TaxID=1608996 RepID=UPI003F9C84DF
MGTCQSCRYFMPKSEVKGECRRSAPTLQIYPNGPNFSVFPPMLADGWCGEFAQKETQQ